MAEEKCVKNLSAPIVCPEVFEPVCATGGKMFGNKCQLDGAKATVDRNFEYSMAEEKCVKKEYLPVLDTSAACSLLAPLAGLVFFHLL